MRPVLSLAFAASTILATAAPAVAAVQHGGRVADPATNTCVSCPADQTIDLASLGAGPCDVSLTLSTTVPAPEDLCPETYWIDVTNLDTVTSLGCSHLAIEAVPEESLTALTCPNRVSHLQVFDPTLSQLYSHGAAGTWHAGTCPPPTPSNPVCVDPPRCDFGVNYTISAASIAGGLDTVRLIPFAGDTTTNLTQVPAEVRLGISGIVPP